MMYGQMTAGSWIYIGSQGIVQGTYETFGAVAREHFGGTLAGRFVLTAGLGGMGGAQPLAATMNGAAMLGIEVDESRIDKRLETGYCDRKTRDLDEALAWIREATAAKRALSVGLVGNAAEFCRSWCGAASRPTCSRIRRARTTRSTATSRRACRSRPRAELRRSDPDGVRARERRRRSSSTCARCSRCSSAAPITFDYGNNIRTVALDAGVDERVRRFPASCPSTSGRCSAKGRDRSAGSRCPAIRRTSRAPTSWCSSSFRTTSICAAGSRWRGRRVHSRDLPARICWLGQGERARFGVALNDLVASGEMSAPIVIGRDHLDTGSVASPFRETEAMKDGSDAVADWPILNALLNTASGASWVSFHHGGGVGIGNSLHAGQVIVADGTPEMRVRLERVLTNDPGIGVARHADAGYDGSRCETARRTGDIRLPMRSDARPMLSARFKPWHVALFLGKYAWLTARRRPVLVHFEVTLRCNARCVIL